jgi:hypothetical protein
MMIPFALYRILSRRKEHEITIPESYVPRSDYATPEELAGALKIASGADEMFLSHLGYEKNLKALMDRLDVEYMRSRN